MKKSYSLKSGLSVLLMLALVACGNVSSPAFPEPDPAGLTNVVSGTLSNWGETGTATGTARIETQHQVDSTDPSSAVTLTTGTVSADGRFSINLPGAAQVTPYLQQFQQGPREGCTGEFKQSAPKAGYYVIDEYAIRKADGTLLGYTFESNPGMGKLKLGDYFIDRYFVDQAGTVTGTLSCPTFKANLNLNLKAGWNAVVVTPTQLTAEGKVFAYTLTTPSKLPVSEF